MAKILVADDNSNVQKTVVLALADLGVDVVSVNNGEAAVRKLPDFLPDLVLADIFMPVRNGYEVCDYVKKNPRFAHVPVVLLVGAFDPFDEREAQRVGADGILKKPFVPPDPLITMVKTLLDRTMSQRLVESPVSKSPVAVLAKNGAAEIAEGHPPVPEISEEPPPQEFPVPAARVAFGEGEPPVAFGQLLDLAGVHTAASDTGSIEPAGDTQIRTSERDATLGEPIFWRSETPEVEPETELSLDSAAELEMRTLKQAEDSLLPPREEASLHQLIEPLELVHEEQDATLTPLVDLEPLVPDGAGQTPLNVNTGKTSELAADPMGSLATAPAEESDVASEMTPRWDEPIADTPGAIDAVEPSGHSELTVNSNTSSSDTPTAPAAPTYPQSPEDTARSVPKYDGNESPTSLDAGASKLETQEIKTAAQTSANVPVPAGGVSQDATANPSQSSAPDPALVEAVVQRVLDKMRPQVVDIITREFLRPVVLALVHREIEKH